MEGNEIGRHQNQRMIYSELLITPGCVCARIVVLAAVQATLK